MKETQCREIRKKIEASEGLLNDEELRNLIRENRMEKETCTSCGACAKCDPCDHCGKCRKCGREIETKPSVTPWYPYWPWYQQPYYYHWSTSPTYVPPYTITCSNQMPIKNTSGYISTT